MKSLPERLSIEGKSLRNKLTVIAALMFILPFLVFTYILYEEDVFLKFEYPYVIMFGLTFVLALAGLIILRKVFDGFFMVSIFMKKAEVGDMYIMEVQKHTAELADIATSFNRLMEKFEDTTKYLQEQTAELKQEITRRRETEELLFQSKHEWEDTFNSITDMITVHDKDWNIIRANKAAEKILGLPFLEKTSDTKCFRYYHGTEKPPEGCPSCQCLQTGIPAIFELFEPHLNMFVEIRAIPRFDSNNQLVGLIHVVRDITEHKRAEEKIKRLYSLQTIIKKINHALLNVKNEPELFQKVCDLLTQVQDVKFVWIGLVVEGSYEVKPVAQSGFGDGYLSSVKVTWDDTEYGRGPTGMAIKTGQPFVMTDIENDPRFLPWRKDALKRGYASSMALPLVYNEEIVMGALNVYSEKKDVFGDEEIGFLIEVANDIAVGIKSIKIEESLVEREKRYRHLVESVTDYIYTVKIENGQPVATTHSPTCVAVTGYTSEEYEADPYLWYRMIHEKDRDAVTGQAAKGLSGADVSHLEHRIIHKDGSIRWVKNTPVFHYDENGHLISYDGLITDITELKQAEESLRASREYAKNIIESSLDMIIAVDHDRKITGFNRAAQETFGYMPEEIIGKHVDILYANPDEGLNVHKTTLKNGRYVNEILNRRKNGEVFPCFLSASVLCDAQGKVVGVMGVSRDITERRYLEDQLRHVQKMEAIGQLAGGVAHDFNNILTAIIGYGNLLKMKTNDVLLRSYVDPILASSERAAALTQNLLTFGRKQMITLRAINLNELVKRIGKLLLRVITENIELDLMVTDTGLTAMADSGQIEQVLINLCTNARDAMPDGGVLTIKTERVELDNEYIRTHGYGKPGTYALISVSDTGIGMDEKTREKIFEPFFTTKEIGKGTGLGLSIVYGIIKQHNGYINCYSESGIGTIFKIYLPLTKAEVEETKPSEGITPIGGTETILLAEDEAEVRKITKNVLEEFGYKVIEAVDGEDAINKFMENKDRTELLLLDVVMPRKNGREVYEMIRKTNPDIKVLFASGYDSDFAHKNKIIEAGLDFISKPVSPTVILKKVREVLDK